MIFLKERSLPSALDCGAMDFRQKEKGTAYGRSIKIPLRL